MSETHLGAESQPATMNPAATDTMAPGTPSAPGTQPMASRDPIDPVAPGTPGAPVAPTAPGAAAGGPPRGPARGPAGGPNAAYGPSSYDEDPYDPVKLDMNNNAPMGENAVLRENRGHIMLMLGEFFGTFFFLWPSFMIAQVANQYEALDMQSGSQPSQLIMIALGFGISFFGAFILFSRFSGNFNPVVTLTLLGTGKLSPFRAGLMWLAQFLAGMGAAGAAAAMTPGPVRFTNSLGGNCSRSRGLFIELFTTAFVCSTVLFIPVEKYAGVLVSGLGVGIALFLGHLASLYYTGAGLNPARSLGASIAAKSFDTSHWIYWVGPILGSGLAVGIWHIFKITEGEDARRRALTADEHGRP